MDHLNERHLSQEITSLTRAVEELNSHRFIRVQGSLPRLMFWQFMRGLAFGLGSVVGATLLVSVLIWWLSQIEFVPILGDWASAVIDEISSGASDLTDAPTP